MKKIFAFFMAVLILAFSMIPCADDAAVDHGESVRFSVSKSASQKEPHEDACSPFCICTCCAGFSVTHTSTLLSLVIFPDKKIRFSLNESATFTIALAIWQPPQLV